MPKVKIGVSVGVTLKVGDWDFIKPSAFAEVAWDDLPEPGELDRRWQWLWQEQVGRQAEDLIDMMQKEVAKRVGAYRDGPVQSPGTQQSNAVPPPDGASYA